MTIVGEVSLAVHAVAPGFQAELIAIGDKAAAAAGRSAGALFAAEFAGAVGKAGTASKVMFARSSASAREAGTVAGRQYAAGFASQSKLTTSTVAKSVGQGKAAAREAGVVAGRQYAVGFAESSKAGAAATATAVPGAARRTAAAEAQGVAEGRALARGQAVGSAEGGALSTFGARGGRVATTIAEREGGMAGRLYGQAFGKSSTPLIASVIVLAASAKVAGDFQQDTNVLVTAAKELPENLKIVRKGILDTATQTGTKISEVTDATYDAEKAGYRGAEANEVVRASAQAAREENAKLKTVTGGLTTTMYNYGGKAVQTANALKTASAVSKTTFEQFTSGLGNFESRAKAAGISLPDALGVYSAITQQGLTAQRASQNLGQTIQQLSNPTQTMIDAFGRYGISITDFTDKLGSGPGKRGLSGSLEYLNEQIVGQLGPSNKVLLNTFNQSKIAAHAADVEFKALPPDAKRLAQGVMDGTESLAAFRKDSGKLPAVMGNLARSWQNTYLKANDFQALIKRGGPEAQPYLAAMRQLLGGQQAVSVALAATGNQAETTKGRVDSIADSYAHAGSDVEGWKSTQQLFNVQMDRFKQSITRTGIEIGTALLPALTSISGFFADHPDIAKAAIQGLLLLGGAAVLGKIGGLVSTLGRLTGVIRGVGAAATVTAGETAAVGTAGAAASAGRAGAAGAAGRAAGAGAASRFSPMKLVIPVAITYAAFKVLGLDKVVKPLLEGDVKGVYEKSPGWIKNTVAKFVNGGDGKINAAPGAGSQFSASVAAGTESDARDRLNSAMSQLSQLNASGRGDSPLAKQLAAQLPDLKKQYQDAGTQLGDAQQKAYLESLKIKHDNDVFDSIFGDKRSGGQKLADKLFGNKKGGGDSGPTQLSAADKAAQKDAQLATAGTTTNVKDLADAYGLSARKARDLADSNYSYTQTLGGLGKELSHQVTTLHGGTVEAQNNRLAVSGAALAVQQHANAVRAQTGSQAAGNEVFRAGIATIQDQAKALGYNGDEVNKYVAEVLGIPESKLTEILNTSSTAQKQVLDYLAAMNRLYETKTTTIIANTGAAQANVGLLIGSINQLQDRTVTILVETINRTINEAVSIGGAKFTVHARGGLAGRAGGGLLKGPGTPTSDSILGLDETSGTPTTWVSTDEFVVNAKATKANLGLLEYINRQGLRAGGAVSGVLGGLAKGGKPKEPLLPGTLTTATQAFKAALAALAKEANAIAKIGVTGVLKTTTTDIKAGQAAIAAAVKQGNGPLQKQLAAQLKTAQGKLYATGLNAVRDKVVSPQEAIQIKAAANNVEALTKQLTKLNTVNEGLIDKLKSFVDAETSVRDNIRSSVADGRGLDNVLAASGTAGDVKSQLASNLGDVRTFQSKILELKKRGFSNAIVREVADDGIVNGIQYADLLLSASRADVKGINAGYAAVEGAETSGANAITKATQGAIPGLSKAGAGVYIQQAIFTAGANVDQLIGKAEYLQRTGLAPGQTAVARPRPAAHPAAARPATADVLPVRAGNQPPITFQFDKIENHYEGVNLATAHAQSTRDLSLLLAGALNG